MVSLRNNQYLRQAIQSLKSKEEETSLKPNNRLCWMRYELS